MAFTSLTLSGQRAEVISYTTAITKSALTMTKMKQGQFHEKLSAYTQVHKHLVKMTFNNLFHFFIRFFLDLRGSASSYLHLFSV